ncbi:putative leucine permease transcriptional regulator (SAC3) [Aspergillus lucknowensis]|uniref:SAC3/GANP/Nin1/mts3/eIF-3 p25 family-domain-containing protein n=1 Tax=Aspergillus lucknowensis TaxID=176173 RepID=A0ABR4LUJ5_9EURO
MTSPANPFAVLHRTDGVAASTGRGRGGTSTRSTPFQAKGGSMNASHNPSLRGRGRGRGTSSARAGRGNARGAGAPGNTWRNNRPEGQANVSGSNYSPFSQLKQTSPSASPTTGTVPQQNPSFSGFGRGSPQPFGGTPPSRGGTPVNSRRAPRKQPSVKPTDGAAKSSVPVEDTSTVGSYSDRYEQLKLDRAKQREQAIKDGQMADPNQPMSLNKAITPVGTCTSMCPEFERVERIVQKMVDKSEKYLHPATNSLQNMEAKMLKRFRRSAAGYDEQLPSDIRTPGALLQTMNYLTRHVIGGSEPLGIIHKFVWDRTRSIRNDFSVQQLTHEEDVKIAVTCLERIARFHIVSLHLLSSPANEEPFDRHQEREQLNNTMLSLMYYYDDNRGRISFPNEDEFRAYYIIFSIHDQRPDLEARVQKWPAELRNAPRVKAALELFAAAGNTWDYQGTLDTKRRNAIAQGFYTRFFSLVNSPGVSYLMACVAEIYFNHMRQTAIRSIWKGYCRQPASQQPKNEEWTVEELTSVLCFDGDDQTIQFCEAQDLEFAENANGDLYLNWGTRHVDSVAFQPSSDHSFSENYVESKRAGRSLVAIVLGLNVKEAATLGMIDSSLLSERVSATAVHTQTPFDVDDSLFVSDDDNETTASASPSDDITNVIGVPAAGAGLATAFGNSSQPPTNTRTGPTPELSFPQQPSQPHPPANANPFGSPFSSSNSLGSSVAPSAPSLNPSARPFSPFSSLQTPETKPNTPPPPANNDQPSNIFSSGTTFAQVNQKVKAPAASTSTPFQFPSVPQPVTSQFSTFSPPQAAQQPPSSVSPFSAPQLSPNDKPNQATGSTAGQIPTSIFEVSKPPPQNRAPLFNFNTPEPTTQIPQTTALGISKSQSSPGPAHAPPLFEPKESEAKGDEAPSIFATSQKPPMQSNPIFQAPPGSLHTETSLGQPASQPVTFPKKETSNIPASGSPSSPSNDTVDQQAFPPAPTSTKWETAAPSEPLSDSRPDAPEASSHAPVDAISKEKSSEGAAQDEAERQLAWINSLKEAASRRRKTVSTTTSRKRILEEQENSPAEDKDKGKAPKVPKPEPPPRKSMALSSMKPLPKLPILEAIESMTAQKPAEKKPEPPKPNNVDEDEILLSAARIAAESLRSGPRLLDGLSAPAHYEPWRSSFSPGSSVASSVAFSRSQSPQQSVNGYDIALAPDNNLGLGRTLSRTEQRIRLTGGKGLAYKPLNFTPEKSWHTPPKK